MESRFFTSSSSLNVKYFGLLEELSALLCLCRSFHNICNNFFVPIKTNENQIFIPNTKKKQDTRQSNGFYVSFIIRLELTTDRRQLISAELVFFMLCLWVKLTWIKFLRGELLFFWFVLCIHFLSIDCSIYVFIV